MSSFKEFFKDVLGHLFPTKIRWYEDLKIQVEFAEYFTIKSSDLLDKKGEPLDPPWFYVKTVVQGQKKQRMRQHTNKVQAKRISNNNEEGLYYCVRWNHPMKFKICIQSLFQSHALEFRVMQVKGNNTRVRVDQQVGVASVSLMELYNLKTPHSSDQLKLPIVPKLGYEGSNNMGFLYVTKLMNKSDKKVLPC